VKEFDIFLPLRHNDGSEVEPAKFEGLKRRLLEEFTGVTYFPQPKEGLWRMGDVVYRDEIVIYRVLSGKPRKARRLLSGLKEELKETFRQEEILIIERDVETL
jgi:hypothetical protein